MSKNNEDIIQLSLFSDSDTKVDNACKKIEKNMRDRALELKECQGINTYHNCVYNLSKDKNKIKCQIEIMQMNQDGIRIPPCFAKCGTNECIYYIEKQ